MPVSEGELRGWSASSKLTAGLPGIGPHLQVQFKDGKGVLKAGQYSVQFDVKSAGTDVPNPIAEVIWKTQGNPVRRLISVVDGTTISGLAEAIAVNVSDNSEAITGFVYEVTILVTPGARASNVVPPMYVPIQSAGYPGRYVVPSGLSRTVPIPQNAGITSVHITASSLTSPPILLTEATCWVTLNTASGGGTILKQYDPRFVDWVPVPPSASSLVLQNASAQSIIYGVAFGVDG